MQIFCENSKEVFIMFLENMFRGGSLWGGLVSAGLSQIQDTNALKEGHINKNEYAVHTTANVTGALGVMAGIEYGAVLGTSVLPGVGTVVGSVVGGLLGDRLGRNIGQLAGVSLVNSSFMQKTTDLPQEKDSELQ
jgi:outer membrane lipoprotein SlyB